MVVAPKCTKGNSWATISKHVYSMIESLVADYNIDVSRIYLMGTSFGAQGGWALLSERPARIESHAGLQSSIYG